MSVQSVLGQAHETGTLDFDVFDDWLGQNGLTWQQAARGDYGGLSVEALQFAFLCDSPVRWAKAFLNDPDADTPEPYTFFDYQVPSVMAFDQDVAHQDGAEVGKTREIIVLVLWAATTGMGGRFTRPQLLVCAPQQSHLDEIIMEIESAAGLSEDGAGKGSFVSQLWLKPKRKPHIMHRFLCPNAGNPDRPGISRVYYRPSGHDGEAFRGIHVNCLGLFDEAAKVKNPTIFSEFYRALKPGCHSRFYSVPDGDRNSEYYKLTTRAVENLPPGIEGVRLFRWAKSLMPDPFWSASRKAHFIRVYGGEDSPGYQRNVEGNHGQQSDSVFPWHVLEKNIVDVAEYRGLVLLGQNDTALSAEAYKITGSYNGKGKFIGEPTTIVNRHEEHSAMFSSDSSARREAVRALIREFFTPADRGIYWFGADLGYAVDPSELVIYREFGTQLRRIARLSMKGVGYDVQCELIYCLDEIFGFQGSWGVDFGSAGTPVVQMLSSLDIYADGNYEERMTGFNFATATDAIDELGETLMETDKRTGDQKPSRMPAKQLATDAISLRLQRGGYDLPYDNVVLQHYSNHTSREGSRWLIYDKKDDHTIDADRACMLRKLFNEDAGVDAFSSGVYVRGG